MTPDRLRRMLDALERRSPVGGWRKWAAHDIADWPDHALEARIAEDLDDMVGATVPPSLAATAVGHFDFLMLLVQRDQVAARRYLRQLGRVLI